MDGVKVKKVEERDSVLGSVGGAREQTQTQAGPPSPRDGNWDLDCDASGSGSVPDGAAQLLPATAAALPVASDRHESMNWGEESSCKGVAAVPGCPGPGQPSLRAYIASTKLPAGYSVVIYLLPAISHAGTH